MTSNWAINLKEVYKNSPKGGFFYSTESDTN
jgi:hypothetical protein